MGLLDQRELQALESNLLPVARQAACLEIPWMLVGAAGRDLILSRVLDLKAGRATFDVDIAIQVEDWHEFELLKEELRRTEKAVPHDKHPHRMTLRSGVPIDLVPFGPIEVDGKIEWQSDPGQILDVRGFSEALQLSVPVALPGGLEVRVPSLENYLCLKLFAWRDRHLNRPRRDSADIREVLKHADALVSLDTLYEEYAEAMERNEFDATLTCLEIMGQRLGSGLKPETRELLLELLATQLDEDGSLALVRELGSERNWRFALRAIRNGVDRVRTS